MAETATIDREPKPALDRAALEGLGRCTGEPSPLTQLRLIARDVYQATPMPDRVRHLWRYTDAADLLPGQAPLPLGPAAQVEGADCPDGGATALIQPGTDLRSFVSDAAREQGLVVQRLFDAGPVLKRLGHLVGPEHGLFEALNLATFSAGALVYVPRRASVAGPVHLVVHPARHGSSARIMVVLEEGAELSLVEEHRGGDAETRFSSVTELFVGAGARLRHVLVQRWEAGVSGHLTARAEVARDADFVGVCVGFGGARSKVDCGARLVGEGARSQLYGVVLAEGRQHFDHHTAHEHLAPRAWSNIDFRVAASERSRSAYTGLIRVAETAVGSEAYQENRNLLLSKRARTDTIPELEILTDDVTCSHGATVAPVEEEQLFYLRSRGIDAAAALRMIVGGFLEPTLKRLPERLRADLSALTEARLERLARGQR